MSSRRISFAAFFTVNESDASETLANVPSTFLPSFSLTESLVPLVTVLSLDQSFVPVWATRVTGDNRNKTRTIVTAICLVGIFIQQSPCENRWIYSDRSLVLGER